MAAKSAVIQVILSAKDQDLVATMVQAELATQRFGDAAHRHAGAFKEMQESVEGMVMSVKGFIGYEVAAKAVEIISEMITKAKEFAHEGAEFAESLERQARNLDTTAEAMAAFAVMETRVNLQSGTLANSLAKMQVAIESSATYGSAADKTFEKLGLRFSDLVGLSADEQFKLIAEAISHMETATARAEVTRAIFGKGGKELAGILREGKSAFDDAAAAARQYGLVLEGASAQRLTKANEDIKGMQLQIKAYEEQVAAALAVENAASKALEVEADRQYANRLKQFEGKVGFVTRFWAVVGDMFTRTDIYGKGATPYQDAMNKQVKIINDASEAVKKNGDLHAAADKAHLDAVQQNKALDETIMRNDLENQAIMQRDLDLTAEQTKLTKGLNAERIKWLEPTVKAYDGMVKFWDNWNNQVAKAKVAAMDAGGKGFDFKVGKYDAEIQAEKAYAQQVTAFDREVARLDQGSYKTAVEREMEQYSQRNKMYADYLATKRNTAEQVAQLIDKSEKRHIKEADESQRIDFLAKEALYSNFFGNLNTLTADAAKKSTEMFYVNKAFQMAQAEVNAWMAYSNAMAPANAVLLGAGVAQVMAVTALAAGQVAVSQIAAVQPPGRADGGNVSAGGLYRVNERGPEVFSYGGNDYLMTGAEGGNVAPNSGNGTVSSPAAVTVNVINSASNSSARVEKSSDGLSLSVIIEQVDQAIAGGIRSGAGASARAISTTFGLNRARGGR